MPLAQTHINANSPMGANLVSGGAGATFRVWAPAAKAVHLKLKAGPGWAAADTNKLVRDANGYWAGFAPGVKDGDPYRFHVVGEGSTGPKRDPYARELGPGFPHADCVVRDTHSYPWHDSDWKPPAFNDLIIYQFHIGTYYAVDAAGADRRSPAGAKFLDVLDRVEYLHALGVNAIQPLPVVEFATEHSLGYNGTDYYSSETDYCVPAADLPRYLAKLNALLASAHRPPVTLAQLTPHYNQLKALVDVCHEFGMAVLLDVVYNHAGGDFGDESLYFFDREKTGNQNNSQYFTDGEWAGGLVYAFWRNEVGQFLIDNANYFAREFHVDGFRYDEVTVIATHGGWNFCQHLTDNLHAGRPLLPHIAEYWDPDQAPILRPTGQGGAGFDAVWQAGLREAVRAAVRAVAVPGGRPDLNAVSDHLYPVVNFPAAWKAVQHLENHDTVYADHHDRVPRVAALGDPSNSRSVWARGRARAANGLLMTAPGIPMLFMGQEFLEDKPWSDTPNPGLLIYWDGLKTDKVMGDFLHFMQDLVWLRRRQPALRGEGVNVFHVHNDNRVIAYQRWVVGLGRDVVIVAGLNEQPFTGYRIGFPTPGRWLEVFNGDVYENFPNPHAAGNAGSVIADPSPLHGLPASASIAIPPHALLVFARDTGD